MNRRSFVKKSGALAAASTFFSPAALLDKRLNQYGAMLYTVRDLMKTDPANTLLRIRDMTKVHSMVWNLKISKPCATNVACVYAADTYKRASPITVRCVLWYATGRQHWMIWLK